MHIGRISTIYFKADHDEQPYNYVVKATELCNDLSAGSPFERTGYLGTDNMMSAVGNDLTEIIMILQKQLSESLRLRFTKHFNTEHWSFRVVVQETEEGMFWPTSGADRGVLPLTELCTDD